ncbi:hypothetical protein [Salisaeta longa]|uniref:hypothetical protein n=1 Tax=Salisaeta longa TaxID=503170 RepID=UPI0003B66915|nr:hypothetical protein [Salisaeta longa]
MLTSWINALFDAIEHTWSAPVGRRWVTNVMIGSFFAALIGIELQRQGLWPAGLPQLPTSHFYAIDVAFTLYLIVEIVELVLGLADSVAGSLGKQFEVFSLILLRESFKELIHFSEPIRWTFENTEARDAVLLLMTDASGALVIFALVGAYYRLQKHRRITPSPAAERQFVTAKKGLALMLLLTLTGLCVGTIVSVALGQAPIPVFDDFYTVLIFSDILIVLISLRYSTTYHVVFRNSGFAAATVMIRLALAGPRYASVVLGIAAALFAVGLAASYNYVGQSERTAEDAVEQRAPE